MHLHEIKFVVLLSAFFLGIIFLHQTQMVPYVGKFAGTVPE